VIGVARAGTRHAPFLDGEHHARAPAVGGQSRGGRAGYETRSSSRSTRSRSGVAFRCCDRWW
jgi:hypothetical protein